jgi:hypothetical protein
LDRAGRNADHAGPAGEDADGPAGRWEARDHGVLDAEAEDAGCLVIRFLAPIIRLRRVQAADDEDVPWAGVGVRGEELYSRGDAVGVFAHE